MINENILRDKVTKLVFFIATVVLLVFAGRAFAVPLPKVDVCHRTGNGSYHLINVSENALQAHLDHGDGVPGGLVPSGQYIFGSDCSLQGLPANQESLDADSVNWVCPAVRYRHFNGANDAGGIYLGHQDLGVGANRVESLYPWSSPHTYHVMFQYDSGSSTLSTEVDDGTVTSLNYTGALGSTACPNGDWDAVEVLVLNRDTGTTVNLNNVTINGIFVNQDFIGGSTFANGTWVIPYNFGLSDFTIEGDIELDGTFGSSQELSKVQLTVCCAEDMTPAP